MKSFILFYYPILKVSISSRNKSNDCFEHAHLFMVNDWVFHEENPQGEKG